MERVKVQSSNIQSVGWDCKDETLEVEFNKGGLYQYRPVPYSEFVALLNAESKGTYFASKIKPHHKWRRVERGARWQDPDGKVPIQIEQYNLPTAAQLQEHILAQLKEVLLHTDSRGTEYWLKPAGDEIVITRVAKNNKPPKVIARYSITVAKLGADLLERVSLGEE